MIKSFSEFFDHWIRITKFFCESFGVQCSNTHPFTNVHFPLPMSPVSLPLFSLPVSSSPRLVLVFSSGLISTPTPNPVASFQLKNSFLALCFYCLLGLCCSPVYPTLWILLWKRSSVFAIYIPIMRDYSASHSPSGKFYSIWNSPDPSM